MNNRWQIILQSVVIVFVVGLSTVAGFAQAKAAPTAVNPNSLSQANLPSEATVDAFLKHMFGWNQDLTWKIAEIKPAEAQGVAEVTAVFNTPQGQQVFHLYVTPDQKFAITGDMVPFGADPFAPARAELKAANGPSHGPADAAVTIVEFGDLECPACKAAQGNINKLIQEEPKAKLVFQNFPLETLHKWALLGAKYVECIGKEKNDVVWKFIGTVYDNQGEITADTADSMLKGYAKDSGADPTVVSACVANPETEKRVRESLALGAKLGINSTPTFFINGRKVVGFGTNTPYEVVKSIVDYGATSGSK
jgi:protein-disulfide isomerase